MCKDLNKGMFVLARWTSMSSSSGFSEIESTTAAVL